MNKWTTVPEVLHFT